MFNVCPSCGDYRADRGIEPEGVYAKCANCGFRHKFLRLPLFILTGASGVGKSNVCLKLAARIKDVVVMESDILPHSEFDQPQTNYREYRETWLRVCKYISQAGKPVVLCGVAEPTQFEQCIERRYFSELHYLALICNEQIHASRLQNRPMWSGSSRDKFIKEQVRFNRWLLDNARITEPPMTLLDTSELTVDETVEKVVRWIQSLMNGHA
jgi:2-phosphoglycerate kinase